jgi:hypothetical protein
VRRRRAPKFVCFSEIEFRTLVGLTHVLAGDAKGWEKGVSAERERIVSIIQVNRVTAALTSSSPLQPKKRVEGAADFIRRLV